MRWPLRYQILLPLVAVMIGTLLGVSVLNAWLSTRRTKQQIEQQLRGVARTFVESNIPPQTFVLNQTSSLSGAEFLVSDANGTFLASSGPEFIELPKDLEPQDWRTLTLDRTTTVAGQPYFVAAFEFQRPLGTRVMYIYYPEQTWREARDQAVYPPLLIGIGALAVLVLLAGTIAARVTRPIARLRSQVEHVAEGDFQPMPMPQRNDEIRDLGVSINRMSEMLAQYEEKVRQSERLRTLGQLGGGIAHQMRNAATGLRMALDLHSRDCPTAVDNEELSVASRQLTLMEKYLQRFLTLGQPSSQSVGEVNLAALLESVLPLIRPTARHIGVELETQFTDEPLIFRGDADGLEQLLVNLLLNAVEAAAESPNGRVVVETHGDDNTVQLIVKDSGSGPSIETSQQIFEPLVTTKPDGAGLGLSVAREITQQHSGEIHWERRDEMTCFVVQLPVERARL